jgi:nucleotide-binding universal stress UspA family protein
MPADRLPVVVGVDGSEGSLNALRWAAAEAAAHHAPLLIVQVLDPRARRRAPYAQAAAWDVEGSDDTAAADGLIERHLLDTHAVESVRRVFEVGIPAEVLLKHALDARMLVLGYAEHRYSQGADPFHDGPALGAIARACIERCTCPVVLVPTPVWHSDAPTPQRAPATSSVKRTPVEGARTLYPRFRATPVSR